MNDLNQELQKMADHLETKARLTKAEDLLRRLYSEHQTLRESLREAQGKVTHLEGALRAGVEEVKAMRLEYSLLEERLEQSSARNIARKNDVHIAHEQTAKFAKIAEQHCARLRRIPRFIRRLFSADFDAD